MQRRSHLIHPKLLKGDYGFCFLELLLHTTYILSLIFLFLGSIFEMITDSVKVGLTGVASQ